MTQGTFFHADWETPFQVIHRPTQTKIELNRVQTVPKRIEPSGLSCLLPLLDGERATSLNYQFPSPMARENHARGSNHATTFARARARWLSWFFTSSPSSEKVPS